MAGRDEKDLSNSLSAISLDDAHTSITIQTNGYTYITNKIVGRGSFGVVFKAHCVNTNSAVAIKKVLQDKRFKNRELEIMKTLNHTNIVRLENSFHTTENKDKVYLHLVLEYVPETIDRVTSHFNKHKTTMPLIYVKLYIYQLARALGYLHSLGICHRDIKPQNLLVNTQTGELKLCDFGSAKNLVPGEASVSYICSRYYRAPELIFNATNYTTDIDLWSVGCVLGEMLIGKPLFPGNNTVDQLIEIIKVLGTPSKEQVLAMNHTQDNFKFPPVSPKPWEDILLDSSSTETIDLLSKLLVFNPRERLRPLEVCAHPFFDELREENTRLPNSRELPPLFDFSLQELGASPPELCRKLIPPRCRHNYAPRVFGEESESN